MKKENILGFDICISNYDNLTNSILNDFNNNISNFIVNINPEIIINNYNNKNFIDNCNKQTYQIPDGSGIIWASKQLNGNINQRITGIDLMLKLCENFSTNAVGKIFLYGAKKSIAEKTKYELENLFPNVNIVGYCNGYEKEEKVLKEINKSEADVLFVGLGSPKQEEFILKNQSVLNNIKIFMPVGGSFDVISKSKKRAPNWIIKLNLEWLYRLFQEPKRFFRQLKLIKFIFLIKKVGGK